MKNIISTSIVCLLIGLTIISCSKSGGTTGTVGTGGPAVSIGAMSYTPSTITVKVGVTVKWTNGDYSQHTVTSDDGSTFNSGPMNSGISFSYTPTAAGTFPYHCTIHGTAMAGTLIVTP